MNHGIRRTIAIAVGSIAALIAILLSWGLLEPRFYEVDEYTVLIPGLPDTWEGTTVAQISDMQTGMWLDNSSTVRRIIEYLIDEAPALVLITGDFVYAAERGTDEVLDEVVELLAPLPAAGIPTFAVLGNHDYGMMKESSPPRAGLAEAVDAALEGAGIRVLENEALPLRRGYSSIDQGGGAATTPLYLVGIGAHWPRQDNPKEAFAEVPEGAPRIVMAHHPDSFEAFPPYSASFTVAGHTHGGQVRIPFTPQWSWLSFTSADRVYVDGWIASDFGAAGNRLYVNRGIGFSTLPLRINAPPQVSMFTLRSE